MSTRKLLILLMALLLALAIISGVASAASAPTTLASQGDKLVLVQLSDNGTDDNTWSYSVMSGTGRVKESSVDAYEAYIKARDGTQIVDSVVPGSMPFVFEGTKAGTVTLKFEYKNPSARNEKPEWMQIVSFEIYGDKTLAVTENNSIATNQSYTAVILPFDYAPGEWTYTQKGAGQVSEAYWEDYQEQLLKNAAEYTEDDIADKPPLPAEREYETVY